MYTNYKEVQKSAENNSQMLKNIFLYFSIILLIAIVED